MHEHIRAYYIPILRNQVVFLDNVSVRCMYVLYVCLHVYHLCLFVWSMYVYHVYETVQRRNSASLAIGRARGSTPRRSGCTRWPTLNDPGKHFPQCTESTTIYFPGLQFLVQSGCALDRPSKKGTILFWFTLILKEWSDPLRIRFSSQQWSEWFSMDW